MNIDDSYIPVASFYPNVIALWNSLSPQIINSSMTDNFKILLLYFS